MKIALLNLPYDNNYGGNLQRYALIKTLQSLGHEVTHINLRFVVRPSFWYMMPRIVNRVILRLLGKKVIILREWHEYQERHRRYIITEAFYQKYIPHSKAVAHLEDYPHYDKFDVIMVGSDQVWRRNIARGHTENLFMDFLPEDAKQKRIAYGVSLGANSNEFSKEDILNLGVLYKRFDAVSVREYSALALFEEYGWTSPKASKVVDPTLLLKAEDYHCLMQESKKAGLFCYILDMTEEKEMFIKKQSSLYMLPTEYATINKAATLTIEEWLSCFYNAKSVITDSFHGMIFSIIFHKPFIVIGNELRGIGRFTSLLESLDLQDRLILENDLSSSLQIGDIDWNCVEEKMDALRKKAILFLKNNL